MITKSKIYWEHRFSLLLNISFLLCLCCFSFGFFLLLLKLAVWNLFSFRIMFTNKKLLSLTWMYAFHSLNEKKTLNPFDILSNRNKYFGKLLTGGRLHENGIIEIKTLAIFRSVFFFFNILLAFFSYSYRCRSLRHLPETR